MANTPGFREDVIAYPAIVVIGRKKTREGPNSPPTRDHGGSVEEPGSRAPRGRNLRRKGLGCVAAGAGSGPAWPGATRRGRLAAARRTSCSRAAPWRSRAAMIACVTFRSSAACAAQAALARFMDRIPTRIPTAATAAAAALTIQPNADTAATVTRISHQKGWGIRSNGVKILHDPRRRAPAECARVSSLCRTSTATLRANAPLFCDFRQRQRRFEESAPPTPGTTGPERFGRRGCRLHLRAQNSAFVFFGLPLERTVRPGPGEPAGGCVGTDVTPLPKAGAKVRLRSLPRGVVAVRNRKCSFFVRTHDSPVGPGFQPRSKKSRRQPGFGLRIR